MSGTYSRSFARQTRFNVFFNNTKVFEVSDDTFDSGSVGLWTKSDSYTFFDDMVMQEMK